MKYLALLLLFISQIQLASSTPLVLTTWCGPPFSNKQQNGYLDVILKEAFAKIGKSIQIETKPAARSLQDANNGITDGDFIRVSNIGNIYPNLLIVPDPIFKMQFVTFGNPNTINQVKNWQDLNHYTTGYVIGWKIVEENIGNLKNSIGVSDQTHLFQMLAAERFEFAVYSKVFGKQVLKNLTIENIHSGSNIIAQEPMYLFLNKKHKNLIPSLVKALREVKKSSHFRDLSNM